MKRIFSFLFFFFFMAPMASMAGSPYDKELAYKVRFGQVSDIELLLKKGANPQGVNELDMPLVSVAASRRDGQAVPILRALIAAHANINQGGLSRQFPIIIAARNGDVEVMDFLLHEALADVSVRDPNGVLPRDIAAQSGYPEIAAMIDEIQQVRHATQAAMRSPERRLKLLHDYVYHHCAYAYLGTYYKTNQDPIAEDIQQDNLASHRTQLSLAMNDLIQVFNLPQAALGALGKESGKRIVKQFEELISNRYRREHGIGQDGDMEKRCEAITSDLLKANPALTNTGS